MYDMDMTYVGLLFLDFTFRFKITSLLVPWTFRFSGDDLYSPV